MRANGRRRFLRAGLGTTAYLALPGRLLARAAAAAPPSDRYPPIIPGFPHILHGGDWNPDQWLHEGGVIEQDFALMEKAGCNTFSIGIFAWATLELRPAALGAWLARFSRVRPVEAKGS